MLATGVSTALPGASRRPSTQRPACPFLACMPTETGGGRDGARDAAGGGEEEKKNRALGLFHCFLPPERPRCVLAYVFSCFSPTEEAVVMMMNLRLRPRSS